MGLGVGYIHVESIDYLQRDFEHAHWDTSTDGACAARERIPVRMRKITLQIVNAFDVNVTYARIKNGNLRWDIGGGKAAAPLYSIP